MTALEDLEIHNLKGMDTSVSMSSKSDIWNKADFIHKANFRLKFPITTDIERTRQHSMPLYLKQQPLPSCLTGCCFG